MVVQGSCLNSGTRVTWGLWGDMHEDKRQTQKLRVKNLCKVLQNEENRRRELGVTAVSYRKLQLCNSYWRAILEDKAESYFVC